MNEHYRGKKRLVFCINSGRAGSEYLATLLGTAHNTLGLHEAEPNMSGALFHQTLSTTLSESLASRKHKASAIRAVFELNPGIHTYAETNHMFIKNFFDVVLEELNEHEIHIVVLRRYLPDVLRSFVRLGFFSDKCPYWPLWMAVPQGPNAALLPPKPADELDHFEAIISYLMDIEARAQRFMESGFNCHIHQVRLEQLQTMSDVALFFNALGLEMTKETATLVGTKINERSLRKTEIDLQTSIEYCEQRIQEYLDLCHRHSIALPPLPQLTP